MQNQIPYISNRDAQLLHRIVNLAEGDPDVDRRPKSALFKSYDKVFTENGLNTNNDKTCFKLVTQMVGDNFVGLGLRQRLDTVLQEAGIILDYDYHGDDLSMVEEEMLVQDEELIDDVAINHTSPQRVARRNSFTSMYDMTLDSRKPPRRRSLSPSLIPNRNLLPKRDLAPLEEEAIQFDRRAPLEEEAIRFDRQALLTQSFQHWKDVARDRREDDRNERAGLAYDYKLKTKAFRHWLVVTHEKRATADQKRKQLIQRKYFELWVENVRSRVDREVDDTYEERLRREALRKWRLELSYKCFKDGRDDCAKSQSLYKMVLVHRASKLERQIDYRLKRDTLNTLCRALGEQKHKIAELEAQADAHGKRRLFLTALQRLGSTAESQGNQERSATHLHDTKVKRHGLLPLREQLNAVQGLALRAEDARFYFLMTRIIKHWRRKANKAKKKRLNEAYKQTRQAGKTNLLRRSLRTWNGRTKQIQTMQEQSEARAEQKDRALVQNTFVKWQIGASERQQQEQQATAQYDDTLRRRYFGSMVDRSRRIRSLESVADRFRSANQSANVATQLRRLSMKGFEIKRREEDADAMRDRHSTSHIRNMLKHWAAKSKHPPSPLSTETTGVPPGSAVQQNSVARTALRELPGGTPGYLNTPSRRVVQMRALAIGNTPVLRFPLHTPKVYEGGVR